MRHLAGDRAHLTQAEPSLGDRIGARLGRWPGPIECEARIASTNDRLKERARAGAHEWSVVLAEEQTAGRGRLGNTWASPRGNLFLSLLLRPSCSAEEAGLIPLMAGIGACDALRGLGAKTVLKWPNDVLVGGRKLGGILTEAAWGEGRLESVVVGVGLNVSLVPDALAGPMSEAVTSLTSELARDVSVEEVAAPVLEQLALWYHRLAAGGRSEVVDAWRDRSAPWWGRAVEVRLGARLVKGVARGIDDTGALLIEEADGRQLTILAGEAQALRLG
ncbi:MAG: biotin--[acetyl-CoA-carboxylase] ligase [Vicinamibacteria bacterium]